VYRIKKSPHPAGREVWLVVPPAFVAGNWQPIHEDNGLPRSAYDKNCPCTDNGSKWIVRMDFTAAASSHHPL